MDKTLQGLTLLNPRHYLKGISNLVLSVFDSGARKNKSSLYHDDQHGRSSTSCHQSLLSVIESEILPRLMGVNAEKLTAMNDANAHVKKLSDSDIEQFAQLCVSDDPDASLNHVQQLMSAGVSLAFIYLELITPAARWLGQQWSDDQIDFTVVTHGLMRMHHITRTLGHGNNDSPQSVGEVKRIFLACAPGSMHVLGLSIVAEFFRSHGWQVVIDISPTQHSLSQALKREWFDMIGLSVGLVEQLPDMPSLIAGLKGHALNPSVLVILGGAATILSNDTTHFYGADGVATQADQAVALANSLLQKQ
jgi:methanogenic corrinoid protein MtbC1